jgi:DNA-binding response OmpR family regulator
MNSPALKILLISDDESTSDAITGMLQWQNLVPILASDPQTGFEQALTGKPELVILDLHWPAMANVGLCQRLRASQIRLPIIVLSQRGEELDKVLLLETGADDYVVKPFSLRELLARIRALLRRAREDEQIYQFGDIDVDFKRRSVLKRGEEVELTRAEYNLLAYLVQHPGHCMTREMILNSVWGYDSCPNTRTVDVHVVRLRKKLESDRSARRHFRTVHGVGYRFLPHG